MRRKAPQAHFATPIISVADRLTAWWFLEMLHCCMPRQFAEENDSSPGPLTPQKRACTPVAAPAPCTRHR